uniref:Membrane insertase YidC/Oxa/ALB C-terminal domain-containing protein n=1 Tax=Parascaris univalens TaxID=6257 RepID=A0A915C421_PARUN
RERSFGHYRTVMDGRTYIGPFQSGYILQRCLSYRSEVDQNKTGSTNVTKKQPTASDEKRPLGNDSIIKAHSIRAEELFERVKKLSGTYVPTILDGMLYFLPYNKRSARSAARNTDNSEITKESKSSCSSSCQDNTSTSSLSDIKFHLAQIEKLVGRSEVIKAAVRGHNGVPPIPATSSAVHNGSELISGSVSVDELRNALVKVKHLQEKEEVERSPSPARTTSSAQTASSFHSVVSDESMHTAIDAPGKWLQELKEELGLLQKEFAVAPSNTMNIRKENEGAANKRAEYGGKLHKPASPSKSTIVTGAEKVIASSAENIISEGTLAELKNEMMSSESVSTTERRGSQEQQKFRIR